jgi:O-antigen/teichoic acid export membrane protein
VEYALKEMASPVRGVRRQPWAGLVEHARTPLYRNAYALIISDTSNSALGLIYWTLAARVYSTEQVGLNSAAISTMIFLAGLSQLSLLGVMVRYIPRAGKATSSLIGVGYGLVLTLAAAVCGVFFVGLDIWAADLFLVSSPGFIAALIGATLVWSIFSLQDTVLAGLRQAPWVPVANAVFGVGKIVLLVAFAGTVQDFGIFASWTIPAALLVVPLNFLIFTRLVPPHAVKTANDAISLAPRHLFRYVIGDSLGSVFAIISTTLLPLLVTSETSATDNAHFYLPWIVAYSLHLITNNLGTSLTVEGATDQAQLRSYSRRTLLQMGRLLLPLVALVVLAAPLILRVFGETYAAEGTTLLRVLTLTIVPYAIIVITMSAARVQGQTSIIAWMRGVACVLVIGLSWVLLPIVGINGVGFAWLFGHSVVAIAVVLTRFHSMFGRISAAEHRAA